jgi:D-alanyl-D-alanine carboxypeptidase/D-alanyl-D-alanine-endopeptidase (penicillin-binding protein 4)
MAAAPLGAPGTAAGPGRPAQDGVRAAQAPTASPRPTAPDLAAGVRQDIAGLGLRKAVIAVSVRDLRTGEVVVDVAGSQSMLPASNMKLLTTGAALHTLGADFRFQTRLLRDGDRLVVHGDGDPSFGDPALLAQLVYTDAQGNRHTGMTVDGLLDRWVDAVRRAGMTRVRELVVDDRVFDREFVHPLWPADQLGNAYCAQVSGLAFHTNLLHAFVAPSGGRGEITRWAPSAPWLRVVNRSRAADKKAAQTIWIGRTDDAETFTLNGTIRTAPADPVAVCVHDMPAFFARLLAQRLEDAGVTVETARTARPEDSSPSGAVIGPVIQMPLATVLLRCNTDSQNLYAESLLKRTGHARTGAPGSWQNGAAALAAAVDARLGLGTAERSLVVSDGSGLSRGNRVTANLLTAWMGSIAADAALRPAFVESLAVAGETGTVSRRFKDLDTSRVFAPCKTGYINGVSCLSGFVGPVGAPPRYAFSVLCNELTEKDAVAKAKDLQERVVKRLAGAL